MKKYIYIFISLIILVVNVGLFAQVKDAPASITATMIVKVAGFEKNISSGSDINIYVLGAPDVAAELQKVVGTAIGKSTLKTVESGTDLPASKPTILFVGDAAKADAALNYSHTNKVLTTTSSPELVTKGVTLGFGIGADSKPKILLNLSGSSEEGLDWNQAILKVAQTM